MTSTRSRIAIVSPYPPPQSKHVYGSGVASYTKNLAEAILRVNPSIEVHVVADRKEQLPKLYVDNGVIVHRVFKRGLFYALQVFKELCRIKPDTTYIQHEYFLYGGILAATLFPLLVALARLASRKVVVTIHGVIPLKLLDNSEFKRENGIHGPTLALKLGLLFVTKLITLFSNKIIVHEPFLKKYLIEDYKEDPNKIIIIPHGVEDLKPLPKEEAKRKLGLEGKKVLLYFGYLTGYKGVKELIEAYREIARKIPNTVLIIAGGSHPRLTREKWYREWLLDLLKRARRVRQEIGNLGKIVFTGYLSEEEIPLYFSAADIVVLPYKARIAASGPEAIAIAFEKCRIMGLANRGNDVSKFITSIVNSIVLNPEACEKESIKLKSLRLWINVAKLYLKNLDQNVRPNGDKLRIVLMIAPEYPPHNIGGGGVVVQNLAKELSSKGYKVIVIAGYYKSKSLNDKPWIQKVDNIHVIWLPLVPTPKRMPYLDTVMPPNIPSAIFLHKVIKTLKSLRKYIVIHLHGYGHLLIDYAAALLRINRIPYVMTIHGIPKSPFYLGSKLLKRAFSLYAKLIGIKTIAKAAKVTVISSAIAKEAIAYGAKPDQIVIIPNGIDPHYPEGIKIGEFRKKYGIPYNVKIILCIGRLHPRKGFQYVISAMPYILKEEPNVVLIIVGDGPYRKTLEALAKKLGVERKVVFTGYVDEQTKKEALADSDVVIVPSLIEPFGLVALEAIAMGKPVIVSNVGGLRDIVAPLKELCVNPRNVNEIADKVKILLKDRNMRSEIVVRLQSKLQRFYWSNIIKEYIDTYLKVHRGDG